MFTPFTLDQLTVFLAVVDQGSFSAAGRHVGRVQSAISHAIAQLEDSLGAQLFDRSGHTPTLTEPGRRLAAEARLVLAQTRELSEAAARLQQGDEPVLRLAVDVIYPQPALAVLCADFQRAFPATALRVEQGLFDDALGAVRAGRVDLGICNLAGRSETELQLVSLGTVQVVPVCSPAHALAGVSRPHPASELRQYVQIVQTERTPQETEDQGVLAARTWRVTDTGLKHALLLQGIGWGSLPEWLVRDDLRTGRLVRLHPEVWPQEGHVLPLHAVTRRDHALGRAGQWMRERLSLD